MKYKILGLSLLTFIVFMLFLWFGPKEGIPPTLLNGNNIDSIRIYKSERDFTIASRTDIDDVTKILQRANRLERIEAPNINSGSYYLNFYTKERQRPIFISILYNKYNGTVLIAKDYTYKGESLDSLIKALRLR